MIIEERFHEVKALIESVGTEARAYFDSASVENVAKGDGSAVTVVDGHIERALLDYIGTHFPDDAVVGEEHGSKPGTSGFVWHIDPLDGTDNFVRKIPFFGVSVARLGDTAEDSFAIVHNPATGQTFSTFLETEGGVYENERLCTMTKEPLTGSRYMLTIGAGRGEAWMQPAKFRIAESLGVAYGNATFYRSSALELAYVAANRIDGYLTFGIKSWDYAAGLFLVRAAGGAISVFENGAWRRVTESLKSVCSTHGKTLFASHPDFHDEVLARIGDPAVWGTT